MGGVTTRGMVDVGWGGAGRGGGARTSSCMGGVRAGGAGVRLGRGLEAGGPRGGRQFDGDRGRTGREVRETRRAGAVWGGVVPEPWVRRGLD